MKKLVIVGGGFAGVWAALTAADTLRRHSRNDVGITLVSRDPWLTLRPRLYESNLDGVRLPLDPLLGASGIERVEGEVVGIDAAERAVAVADRDRGARIALRYDRLILASGSAVLRPEFPGTEHLFTVDTYAEAVALERHLRTSPPTAVVVGAGFTGIEVATELVGRLRARSNGERVRVVLVDGAESVASDLGSAARHHVEQALDRLGIERQLGRTVSAVEPSVVTLSDGRRVPAATTIWTAGFRASTLAGDLPAPRDASGRVHVDALLRVQGLDAVYAAGDVARAMADRTHVAPMSCQHAIPMGERAGANAVGDLIGRPAEPYSRPFHVQCVDLGAAGALFAEGWNRDVRLTGFFAKLIKEAITQRLIDPTKSRSREPVAA